MIAESFFVSSKFLALKCPKKAGWYQKTAISQVSVIAV